MQQKWLLTKKKYGHFQIQCPQISPKRCLVLRYHFKISFVNQCNILLLVVVLIFAVVEVITNHH